MVLSDGQIAEFASAANAGEITVGMVAVTRAQTPAVRDYAQTMISAHNTAQARQTAIVNTLGITTSTSPLSEQLSENAAAVLKQLQNASVTDFDILYVRSQIDMHLQVLQALDEQLLPNVSADALRSELVLTRTEVQGHVESARGLLGLLEDLSDAGVP
jgi:putative membrane protein